MDSVGPGKKKASSRPSSSLSTFRFQCCKLFLAKDAPGLPKWLQIQTCFWLCVIHPCECGGLEVFSKPPILVSGAIAWQHFQKVRWPQELHWLRPHKNQNGRERKAAVILQAKRGMPADILDIAWCQRKPQWFKIWKDALSNHFSRQCNCDLGENQLRFLPERIGGGFGRYCTFSPFRSWAGPMIGGWSGELIKLRDLSVAQNQLEHIPPIFQLLETQILPSLQREG